jgi:hypothetical protein
MSTVIKFFIATTIGFAVLVGILIVPVFFQSRIISKKPSAEYVRKVEARNARSMRALAALTKSDGKLTPSIRAAIAELEKGNLYRPQFAKVLDAKGQHLAAFNLESERVHFLELSLPDDSEMALYANLANKTGHPEEARWALGRMGRKGHFRVWELGTVGALAVTKKHWGPSGNYDGLVHRFMENGLQLYPEFRGQIAHLEKDMLRNSPEQIQTLHDELSRSPVSIEP